MLQLLTTDEFAGWFTAQDDRTAEDVAATLERPLTAAQEAGLTAFGELDEIREAYLEALAAAGFEVVDVPAHTRALREIVLRTPAPGLRLLYGVDEPRSRALVVLGETMDRPRGFYGDSVRRAEQLWHQFLQGDARATQPAPSR